MLNAVSSWKPPDGADSTSQRRECKRGNIGRLECGRIQLEVPEELGIAQSVISRLWQRLKDDGNVSRSYSTGLPRVTTPNKDQYLVVTAKRNRRSTASDLSRQLSSATGTTVSRQTVYRRLGHIGLYARRPVRCVPLTANSLSPAINLE
ncbi:acyl-CoA synthetase family member 2, mitochondrial [Trichonephila clavipes]|nr:acyl-CoA synthetase family member 2, mitochondrial [Trichonephila clavipes]